jgi:hypothetical protein
LKVGLLEFSDSARAEFRAESALAHRISRDAQNYRFCQNVSDVIKSGSAETKTKTETDCTEAEAETKTDMRETKTETETNCAETGRDQEYVAQGQTDQICTNIQKIQYLHIKIMHGITASRQRTVDGTSRKELKKTENKRPTKQKQILDPLRHIK